VHNRQRFSCNACDKSYTQSHLLKSHIKIVHEGIKTIKCVTCNRYFTQKHSLKIHKCIIQNNTNLESLPKGVIFKCDSCDKSFNQYQNLENHIKTIHEGITFECDTCYKSFSTNQSLRLHKESVHEKIRINCDLCDKSFTQKGVLKRHKMSVHEKKTEAEGEKNFIHDETNENKQRTALTFLKNVEETFLKQPQTYQDFLTLLKKLKDKSTSQDVHKKASLLIHDYPELTKEFNQYFPFKYQSSLIKIKTKRKIETVEEKNDESETYEDQSDKGKSTEDYSVYNETIQDTKKDLGKTKPDQEGKKPSMQKGPKKLVVIL